MKLGTVVGIFIGVFALFVGMISLFGLYETPLGNTSSIAYFRVISFFIILSILSIAYYRSRHIFQSLTEKSLLFLAIFILSLTFAYCAGTIQQELSLNNFVLDEIYYYQQSIDQLELQNAGLNTYLTNTNATITQLKSNNAALSLKIDQVSAKLANRTPIEIITYVNGTVPVVQPVVYVEPIVPVYEDDYYENDNEVDDD